MTILSNEEALILARESDADARRSIESLRWYVGAIALIVFGIMIW